jgi:hypothetical protein
MFECALTVLIQTPVTAFLTLRETAQIIFPATQQEQLQPEANTYNGGHKDLYL